MLGHVSYPSVLLALLAAGLFAVSVNLQQHVARTSAPAPRRAAARMSAAPSPCPKPPGRCERANAGNRRPVRRSKSPRWTVR